MIDAFGFIIMAQLATMLLAVVFFMRLAIWLLSMFGLGPR